MVLELPGTCFFPYGTARLVSRCPILRCYCSFVCQNVWINSLYYVCHRSISYLYVYVILRVKSASDTSTFKIHRYEYDYYSTNLNCVVVFYQF